MAPDERLARRATGRRPRRAGWRQRSSAASSRCRAAGQAHRLGGGQGPRGGPAEAARAEAAARAGATVRAVIGDQLRIPITWCEMGSCISWHADPAALGEADNRARAIRAGWRIDALARMACPRCQQTAVSFQASRPLVLWDRYTAITMAARTARGNRCAPAARPAAIPPQARRVQDSTAYTRPPAPCPPTGRRAERQPAPPFLQRGADRGPSPANPRYGRTAPARPVTTDEGLMIQERAGEAVPGERQHAGARACFP